MTTSDNKKCCDWPKIENPNDLNKKVTELNNWKLKLDKENGKEIPKLVKKLEFKDYNEAIDYMNKIGKIANERNHHPDLHLTTFKHLEMVIYTFSLKGLTENDFDLAKAIDGIPM